MRHYALSLASIVALSLAALPLHGVFDQVNIVMLYLLAVMFSAFKFGRNPAIAAAVLGVALFDFFFVAPRMNMAVSDLQYLITFGEIGRAHV